MELLLAGLMREYNISSGNVGPSENKLGFAVEIRKISALPGPSCTLSEGLYDWTAFFPENHPRLVLLYPMMKLSQAVQDVNGSSPLGLMIDKAQDRRNGAVATALQKGKSSEARDH